MGAVERPHAGWWVAVLGGLGATAVLALHPGAFAWWSAHVTAAPSRGALQAIWWTAVALHVGEAAYAARLAGRAGAPVGGWFAQTLALGFPSLRLLLRRTRGR